MEAISWMIADAGDDIFEIGENIMAVAIGGLLLYRGPS
jgi:hypothetical protein